ncbi:MAG TPA: Crp/Fnr family transcriptional regulator [Allosphingosinicella sp.]|nr:Crp/Fnr family transcriptional regulator [Allosphingosinicella sp.]
MREVEPRRDLIREGEKPRAVNLILEGWGSRYKQLPDGRRQILSFVLPGELCDPNVFILREMDHSIGAITRMRYAEIAPADFQELMTASPRLTQGFWWNELAAVATAREWIANVGQRNARERIAHLLCELFIRLRLSGLTEGDACDFPPTQHDLADATGLTSVHVNRTLQDMRREGLIELRGRRLIIPDLDALKQAAGFKENYLHLQREQAA